MDNFRTIENLLKADRSIRRFKNEKPVNRGDLEKIVSLAHYCASGRNLQPLKYILVDNPGLAAQICKHMKWAGYLTDWDGPAPHELPPALILQCLDTRLTENPMIDEGIQLQALTLGATALGLGGCIVKSFNAAEVTRIAEIPDWLKIGYILALGYPAERVRIEETEGLDANIRYWRDNKDIHHVPKRKDIIV